MSTEIGASHCRVTNPGVAARVIYDGIKNAGPIRIMPGETIDKYLGKTLILSDLTIERLRAVKRAHENELEVEVIERLDDREPHEPKPMQEHRELPTRQVRPAKTA